MLQVSAKGYNLSLDMLISVILKLCKNPNSGSYDHNCLHFKFEGENFHQIVPIRIGHEFRNFAVYSINEPRIELCQVRLFSNEVSSDFNENLK